LSRSRVVVATRKSALALAQSRAFIARLAARHPHVAFEELLVTTTGDVVQDRALAEIGTTSPVVVTSSSSNAT